MNDHCCSLCWGFHPVAFHCLPLEQKEFAQAPVPPSLLQSIREPLPPLKKTTRFDHWLNGHFEAVTVDVRDVVCGCTTTCTAAPKQISRWSGIAISGVAHAIVDFKKGYLCWERFPEEDLIVPDGETCQVTTALLEDGDLFVTFFFHPLEVVREHRSAWGPRR